MNWFDYLTKREQYANVVRDAERQRAQHAHGQTRLDRLIARFAPSIQYTIAPRPGSFADPVQPPFYHAQDEHGAVCPGRDDEQQRDTNRRRAVRVAVAPSTGRARGGDVRGNAVAVSQEPAACFKVDTPMHYRRSRTSLAATGWARE